MLRRIPRILRNAVLAMVLVTVAVTVLQSWSESGPGSSGWTQTQWGPLGPADRDLLVKVRLAGLWEQPTGQQAAQQANSPEVKEVGHHISTEHGDLDAKVREVSGQLGVLLPTSPSAQQLAWMGEITARTGTDYDRMFVQRLREAHGTVLGVIAQVRAGTRNTLIRSFATTATEFVSRHISYLESTGLVDYNQLPTPPSPGLLAGGLDGSDLVVPIAVFVAALVTAFWLVMRWRRRSGDQQRPPGPLTGPLPIVMPAPRFPTAGSAPIESTGPRHAIRR